MDALAEIENMHDMNTVDMRKRDTVDMHFQTDGFRHFLEYPVEHTVDMNSRTDFPAYPVEHTVDMHFRTDFPVEHCIET